MTHSPEELRRLAEAATSEHQGICGVHSGHPCDCQRSLDNKRLLIFARTAIPELLEALEAAQRDAARLDWVIAHSAYRVMGRERSWSVMDCSNGLTFLVQGSPTSRDAIDVAMQRTSP